MLKCKQKLSLDIPHCLFSLTADTHTPTVLVRVIFLTI